VKEKGPGSANITNFHIPATDIFNVNVWPVIALCMEHQLSGYNGTDLCNFPIAICHYADLLQGHCHQCEIQDMAWQRPGDQRALYPYRNRHFKSLFREIRIIRYDECSV